MMAVPFMCIYQIPVPLIHVLTGMDGCGRKYVSVNMAGSFCSIVVRKLCAMPKIR